MKRILLWLTLLFVGVAATLSIAYDGGYLPFPVQTATVAAKQATATTAMGVTQSAAPAVVVDAKVVPALRADLGFTGGGVIMAVAVREGAVVTPGQRLVQLETKDALVAIA